MKTGKIKLTKILSVALVVTAVLASVIMFIHRDTIQTIGAYGYLGVFLASFALNATILLPAPSSMLILSASAVFNPILVILCGAVGAACGELIGYGIGRAGKNIKLEEGKWIKKL
ncbi:MAG: hypothetical protein LBQ91_01875, partial [Oscillospiraceae bacterium]|nr:hypothetical protein [Oscillospiraceae bacterium]